MSAPPLRTAISDTYPNPSNATARAGFGALYDYVTSFPFGQCRLVKSGGNLVLQRYNGLWLTINGVVNTIPSAGVSLAATGLTAGTLYYIYAFMSGATMTLEASTTGHATDSTTGVEIKTGDVTRTLVGMARPITGPAWQDAATQRFVVSWFNRQSLGLQTSLSTATGNASVGVYTIISNTLLLEFLSWNTVASARFQGALTSNVANAVSTTATFLDATNTDSYTATGAYATGAVQPVACSLDIAVSEGYHTFNVYAQQSVTSTATYLGGIAGLRCSHSAVIQG